MLAAYAMLASSMVLVGANVPVAKLLAEDLPIPLIAFLRCLIACAVLWPLQRLMEGVSRPGREVMRNLFWQAAFGTALYNAGLLAGLRFTTALEGGLVLATLPTVVALGAALWLGERLSPRAWAAAALAALGMGAINVVRAGGGGGEGSTLGNALVFAGVVGEAVYVLLAKRAAGRVGVVTAAFWMQVFSAAQLAPFALASLPWLAPGAASVRNAVLLAFHSLTASVLCLLLWYGGMKRADASVAGVFSAFLPATAALVGVIVLGERFTAVHAVGLVVMVGSIFLATWPARTRAG